MRRCSIGAKINCRWTYREEKIHIEPIITIFCFVEWSTLPSAGYSLSTWCSKGKKEILPWQVWMGHWNAEVWVTRAISVYQLQRSNIVRIVKHCCFSPWKENPFQLLEWTDGIRLIRSRELCQLPETETAELFSRWDYVLV